MTQRDTSIKQFLHVAGWQAAQRSALAGDASARRYLRLRLGDQSAILMDSPLGGVDDPAQFVAIARHLAQLGLSPPRILAQDLRAGLLLLEDLGDEVFARLIAQNPACEGALYASAVQVLAHIQANPAPPGLPNLTPAEWAQAAMLAPRRYSAAILGHAPDDTDLASALTAALTQFCDGPRVMILRDYHAENLMHLPNRAGLAQVGLLDFQLAQMGQPAYDLVSLIQDVRRDVSSTSQTAALHQWLNLTGGDDAALAVQVAVIGAQRALRILGIFAQLCTHSAKPAYLDMIPRVWHHLQQNLTHPALRDLAAACAATLPPPSPTHLAQIRMQCQHRP